MIRAGLLLFLGALCGCASAPDGHEPQPSLELPAAALDPAPPAAPPVKIAPPRIALVLGGGAAKGFAHIGVIKALESQGVHPDIVVGTSAGSVVGVLYAAGNDGFALQRIALDMKEAMVSDWSLPDRGFLKGEALQEFINRSLRNRPLEKLDRTVAVVATELQTGATIVFQRGDAGMAVRASSSVPGVFRPVHINGKEYVDGGLVSPVPVRVARGLGADIVIASDISAQPQYGLVQDSMGILLQTFAIMGRTIANQELVDADVVVKPDIAKLHATGFSSRHLAILEGERAGLAAMPELRRKLALREERLRTQGSVAPAPAPSGN